MMNLLNSLMINTKNTLKILILYNNLNYSLINYTSRINNLINIKDLFKHLTYNLTLNKRI